VIIDQFLSASEDKWNLPTGLVLLLPHGYEGQGPEHSSARIERFMQLAAEGNMNICQPSNAAQYFHLLRRQALRPWRKPLIVFTPKSMLRHPDASSNIEDFTRPRFLTLVPDNEVQDAHTILLASGKVGHELRAERRRRKDTSTAIFFLDQLYPQHGRALLSSAALGAHRPSQKSSGPLRETLRQCQPCHRLREGSRARAKNAHHSSFRHLYHFVVSSLRVLGSAGRSFGCELSGSCPLAARRALRFSGCRF
jgi:hypothetical protein